MGTHLCGSRYALTRYTQYVPTKMRIHFLQNVSHSAAHYRRNEKGMIRGGNSDKEDTSRTKKRRRKRELKRGRREKAALEEGKGTRRSRTKGGGKGEPEHFVKQGKMRLRRGTTATFLSLQNYVFRGPPPYLSKHNKFPLCLSRSSCTSSSAFSSSTTPTLPRRLFFRRSPRVCNRDTSVLLPCRGYRSASHNVLLVYFVLRRRILPSPSSPARTTSTPTCRSTSFRGSIHVHRFPPTNSSR